jgi:menaquinone-dependent protoporphyrinogen oxidase
MTLAAAIRMDNVLIIYGTREGHTRDVAARVADMFRAAGHAAEAIDVSRVHEPFALSPYAGVIVAASVHQGSHESEMAAFVKRHLGELTRLSSAFLSVSLAQADAENPVATPEKRAEAARAADAAIAHFSRETGWLPDRVHPVAGALPYTRYNVLQRWVMTRIARGSGHPTDTSRDHVFTDWTALQRFVREFAGTLRRENDAIRELATG